LHPSLLGQPRPQIEMLDGEQRERRAREQPGDDQN
jgi:hypothetical protein